MNLKKVLNGYKGGARLFGIPRPRVGKGEEQGIGVESRRPPGNVPIVVMDPVKDYKSTGRGSGGRQEYSTFVVDESLRCPYTSGAGRRQ